MHLDHQTAHLHPTKPQSTYLTWWT